MSKTTQHQTVVETFFEKAFHYRRHILFGFLVLLAFSGAVGGYWWYRTRVAKLAHKAYAEAADLIKARVMTPDETKGLFEVAFSSEDEKWQAVADAFKRVSDAYPHVGVGALAGIARGQALLRVGKVADARAAVEEALPRIASVPLRSLYTQLLALLLLDSAEPANIDRGLVMLQQLIADSTSPIHDSALYHLGAYHWHKHDFAKARDYWQQLLLQYDKEDISTPSEWVSLVKEKLALIDHA